MQGVGISNPCVVQGSSVILKYLSLTVSEKLGRGTQGSLIKAKNRGRNLFSYLRKNKTSNSGLMPKFNALV